MEKNEATHKCKVFLHIRDHGKMNWTNERYDFARVPTVGEYVSTSTSTEWFKVQLVLHTPFSSGCDAEVYAVAVNHADAKKRAMPDMS